MLYVELILNKIKITFKKKLNHFFIYPTIELITKSESFYVNFIFASLQNFFEQDFKVLKSGFFSFNQYQFQIQPPIIQTNLSEISIEIEKI